MAKRELELFGDFDTIIDDIDSTILTRSSSATLEDQTNYSSGNVRLAFRVYERFSIIGSNRVSLSLTLLQDNDRIICSVITSGGSQAVFMKMNTIGERSFLDSIYDILKKYEAL